VVVGAVEELRAMVCFLIAVPENEPGPAGFGSFDASGIAVRPMTNNHWEDCAKVGRAQ
jgi:hypothetical protein